MVIDSPISKYQTLAFDVFFGNTEKVPSMTLEQLQEFVLTLNTLCEINEDAGRGGEGIFPTAPFNSRIPGWVKMADHALSCVSNQKGVPKHDNKRPTDLSGFIPDVEQFIKQKKVRE